MPDAGFLKLGSLDEKLDRGQAALIGAFDNFDCEAKSLIAALGVFDQFRLEVRDHGDVGAVLQRGVGCERIKDIRGRRHATASSSLDSALGLGFGSSQPHSAKAASVFSFASSSPTVKCRA